MVEKDKTIDYCSGIWGRTDLPIDSSGQQLAESVNRSRTMLASTLEALEPGNKREPDSLFYQVFHDRLDPWRESRVKDDNTAAAVYWEITDLLRAMITVRGQARLKGEELAWAALWELGQKLMNKESKALQYPDYYALRYEQVRKSMFQKFEPEINLRLQYLWMLLAGQSSGDIERNLRMALPVLDNLILDLTNGKTEEQSGTTSGKSSVSALKSLYNDLLKTRKEITIIDSGFRKVDFGKGKLGRANEELAAAMTRAHKTFTEADKRAFESNFNCYLCEIDDNLKSERPKTQAFMERYAQLSRYIGENSVSYEEEVRRELYEYVKKLFDDLDHLNNMFYRQNTYGQESKDSAAQIGADTAFLGKRLENAHEQIQSRIHIQMRVLRITNTMKYLEIGRSKRDAELTEWLKLVAGQLGQEFQDLPLYREGQTFDVAQFAAAYNQRVPRCLGCRGLDFETISEAWSEEAEKSLRDWAGLLRLECELVAIHAADETVQACMEEVRWLKTELTNYRDWLQENTPKEGNEH